MFIVRLFRAILLFWLCSFGVMIAVMIAANLAMSHR